LEHGELLPKSEILERLRAARFERRDEGAPRDVIGVDGLDNVATCGHIDTMKAVGIRELKNRLSEYVRLVKNNGESILVTDRGAIVAELRPPGQATGVASNPIIDSLIRQANVTIGAPNHPDLYPPQQPVKTGTATKLLDAERAQR